MTQRDRSDWRTAPLEQRLLVERYDRWASTYDAAHDEWGWTGPGHVVDALTGRTDLDRVLDAGCGTGRVGTELRQRGYAGHLVGVDLSVGMLRQARARFVYDDLIEASILTLPTRAARFDAVVAAGVFTHGHLNRGALPEFVRVVRSGGVVVITIRDEAWGALEPHATALEAAGAWHLLDRTALESYHLGRDADDRPQMTITWRVG